MHETVAELRAAGVAAVAEPHFGEPAATLTAQSGQLGLLVLGSHAYGSLHRALFGQLSTQLLLRAACPLIVVPAGRSSGLGASQAPVAAHLDSLAEDY